MTIKDKQSTDLITIIGGNLIALAIAIALSYLTLYLATQTGAATTDMVTFVYGVGTLGVGVIALAAYIGTAAITGIGIASMVEPSKEK